MATPRGRRVAAQERPPETRRGRWQAILGLGLPIVGGMVSQNLLNLVDTAMVGRLGAAALGATGLGGMANWLAGAFFMGLGSGVQAITSRRIGQGDPAGAVTALHAALVAAVAVALPLSLVVAGCAEDVMAWLSDDPEVVAQGGPYLAIRMMATGFVTANFAYRGYWNGLGLTTVYLRTIVVMHLVNIVLNWLLIYGNLGAPEMGVRGAALASAIAMGLGAATYTVLASRISGADGFLRRWRGLWRVVPGMVRLSVPAGMQNVFFSAGFVTFFWIAQEIGTLELAATNVLITLALTCILPGLGLGLASATLVGQSLGRGEPKDALVWAWSAVQLGMIILSVLGTVLAALPGVWLSLLVPEPEVIAVATMPLIILGLSQPIDGVGVILSQVLLGAGAVATVMTWSITLQWGLFLPLVYYFSVTLEGGLTALWVGMFLWRGLFALAMAWSIHRGRWMDATV